MCTLTMGTRMQTGKVYQAAGLDAVLLMEYAGLRPTGRDKGVPAVSCAPAQMQEVVDNMKTAGFFVVRTGHQMSDVYVT